MSFANVGTRSLRARYLRCVCVLLIVCDAAHAVDAHESATTVGQDGCRCSSSSSSSRKSSGSSSFYNISFSSLSSRALRRCCRALDRPRFRHGRFSLTSNFSFSSSQHRARCTQPPWHCHLCSLACKRRLLLPQDGPDTGKLRYSWLLMLPQQAPVACILSSQLDAALPIRERLACSARQHVRKMGFALCKI
jgi:hypothetical protein